MGTTTSKQTTSPSFNLRGHKNEVLCFAFSPTDNNVIASGSHDTTVRLWSIVDEICTRALKGHTNSVETICFSNTDGDLIASGSLDNTIRLWSLRKGVCTRTLSRPLEIKRGITSIRFSPTSSSSLACATREFPLLVWSILGEGVVMRKYAGHTKEVTSVRFSPNGGDILASGSKDNTVRLWDVHQGTCTKVLAEHTDAVTVVDFSTTGDLLVSGSQDLTIRLWSVGTGVCTHVLTGHTDWVIDVSFSPVDADILASTGDDNLVWLWSVTTGSITHTLAGPSKFVNNVRFSPHNGAMLASGTDMGTILGWVIQGLELPSSSGVFAERGTMIVRQRLSATRVKIASEAAQQHHYEWDAELKTLRDTLAKLMTDLAAVSETHKAALKQAQNELSKAQKEAEMMNAQILPSASMPDFTESQKLNLKLKLGVQNTSFTGKKKSFAFPPPPPLVVSIKTGDADDDDDDDNDNNDDDSHDDDDDNDDVESITSTKSVQPPGTPQAFTDREVHANHNLEALHQRNAHRSQSSALQLARFRSSLQHRAESIAVERSNTNALISKIKKEMAEVQSEIDEFKQRIEETGLASLNVKDVYELLSLLDVPVSIALLKSKNITGITLIDMTEHEMYVVFGIKKLGHRLRLKRELRRLVTKQGFVKITEGFRSWDTETTAKWVADQQHLPFYTLVSSFRENHIDGACLSELDAANMTTLGLRTREAQEALINAVKALRDSGASQNTSRNTTTTTTTSTSTASNSASAT